MIITTSWDDGHPLDLKLADLLSKYGIKGTFYIPIRNPENIVMNDTALTNISSEFEVGGHTVNHSILTKLNIQDASYEITECKAILENKLNKKIHAFCFPSGKFSKRDIQLVHNSGFLFCRSTAYFRSQLDINQSLMHTAVQAYNHKSISLFKNCIKRINLAPIIKNSFFIPYNSNFRKLAKRIIIQTSKSKGIFHIWGHSWEIEEYDLWNELEETFKILKGETDALYLSNTQLWQNKIQDLNLNQETQGY